MFRLELAVYFTGAPYRLEGRGGLWDDLFPNTGSWSLVGSPGHAPFCLPRELAIQELEARAGPGVLTFKLEPRGRHGEWRWGSESWQTQAHQKLHLLALILNSSG